MEIRTLQQKDLEQMSVLYEELLHEIGRAHV